MITDSGFRGTTIKAVAEAADCSTGLIYSYFNTREELLHAAFVHASNHELDVLTRAITSTSTAADAVSAMIRTFVTRALAGRSLATALLFQSAPEMVEMERLNFRLAYAETIVPHIARGVATGELPPQNPRVSSQAVNGSMSGALQEPLLKGESSAVPSDSDLVEELTQTCLRTIGA